MKKNLSDYLIALSVIACSAVLLAALTIALSGYQVRKPTRTLQIKYEDVTGVKVNSEVRYAGAPAGRVIAMRHLTSAERQSSPNKKDAVIVTISLNDDVPPLPDDITASLGADSMLAPKFVSLSAGTPGQKTLPNNAVMEGHLGSGLDEILAQAGPLVENAKKLIDNLNLTVTDLKSDLGSFMPKLGPLVDSAEVDVDKVQKAIEDLDQVETKAGTFLETAHTFVSSTDKSFQEQLRQLHVTLVNLKVITTHAKTLVDALAEKPNRLIFSGKAPKLTPEAQIIKSEKPLPGSTP